MPVYLFKAIAPRHPQTNQPMNIAVGARSGFVLNHPGDLNQAKQYARANAMGSPGVKYVGVELAPNTQQAASLLSMFPPVMLVEINMGVQMPVQAPQLSGSHVNGGQPVGAPVGMQGQNRSSQLPDSSGFQTLGDDVLSGAGDTLMGSQEDGTASDLYGGGHFEVPRQG
jgi:hypothetical protein